MKQLNSLYNSNAQELLGRITLSGKNILNRSAYILVTNEQNMPKGYKAIISTHDFSANTSTPYIKVDNISDFNEGDVINISPNVLKTEDIHPPKTGISVHFSGSLV